MGLQTPSEILQKSEYDFQWPEIVIKAFREDEELVLLTGKASIHEYALPNPSKNTSYLCFERAPLLDEQKHIIGLLAIGFDVSAKHLKEIELQIERDLIEDILYQLPGLIYWKNQHSQYMGFNQNVVQLSGLNRQALKGKTDKDLNWGQKEADSFQKDDLDVLDCGCVKITEHEIPIKRPDGQNMVVRTEKTRLVDREGNIIGLLGVALDITDQKILTNQLIQEKENAAAANKAKSEFLRNMEHQIRTPFCGVFSIVQLLAESETDPEKKQYLDITYQSAKEFLELLNDIIDFSRTQTISTPVIEKKFDLEHIISKVISMERAAALVKHLDLTYEYPKKMPKIFIGDSGRIQRLLLNLLSNAIKFTNQGFVKVVTKLAKQVDEHHYIVQLIVSDSGIGIATEIQGLIYEKFYRGHPANQNTYDGAGLGLSIVKQIIKELEGEIDVMSNIKEGTTFTCTLPMKRPLLDEIILP